MFQEKIEINDDFRLAVEYVNTTKKHLYLTGKAGTGKTTFLQYIRSHTHKKMVIAAPTGVAAINAGGVTLHSLFSLPLGCYIPESNVSDENLDFFNRHALLKYLRLNKQKLTLIQELQLLIIDEVSMLRADILDAIDEVLRSVRRKHRLSFGGVQLLFIGDLFQLPPVTKGSEWDMLSQHYPSMSFYNAKALQSNAPIYLELKNIYRQSDRLFIDILNNIRNDKATAEDIDKLNSYYQPNFTPDKKGEYITLTTHNHTADIINQKELNKLDSESYIFKAEIKGDFKESSVNAEVNLELKQGSQVMFIRNDRNQDRRYYNGKLAVVSKLTEDEIWVKLDELVDPIKVELETWENKKYKLNTTTDELDEDVKGSFIQYPIRLAWAITIHKSQGLTFDKAIIDAGQSFSAGQVYVALSRLTSLDGLVLYSKIGNSCIHSDSGAVNYSKTAKPHDILQDNLGKAQSDYINSMILAVYEWRRITSMVKEVFENVHDRKFKNKPKAIKILEKATNAAEQQKEVADKFVKQLNKLFPHAMSDRYANVSERIASSEVYFDKALQSEIFDPILDHYLKIRKNHGVKKYLTELYNIISIVKHKKRQITEIVLLTKGIQEGKNLSSLFEEINKNRKLRHEENKNKEETQHNPKKQEKGESKRTTLNLYQEGKSIAEIADERGLTSGTIEGHLASFVGDKLELEEFVEPQKIKAIRLAIDGIEDGTITDIKKKLGDEYSYAQVRAVYAHRAQESSQQV